MTIYKQIDVITWFTIASVLISIAFSNFVGMTAFGLASIWCVYQDYTNRNDKYHVHLLNFAGILFALNAAYNAYQAWDNDIIFAIAQILTCIGSLICIIGNILVDKMKRNDDFLKSFQSALITTLANPGFWYAINIVIIGIVALLMNTQNQAVMISYIFILLATIVGIISILSSTKRMLAAKRGDIKVFEINDGMSNMWIARSNSLSLVVILIGFVNTGSLSFIFFVLAQIMFIYGHYVIAKRINPDVGLIKF